MKFKVLISVVFMSIYLIGCGSSKVNIKNDSSKIKNLKLKTINKNIPFGFANIPTEVTPSTGNTRKMNRDLYRYSSHEIKSDNKGNLFLVYHSEGRIEKKLIIHRFHKTTKLKFNSRATYNISHNRINYRRQSCCPYIAKHSKKAYEFYKSLNDNWQNNTKIYSKHIYIDSGFSKDSIQVEWIDYSYYKKQLIKATKIYDEKKSLEAISIIPNELIKKKYYSVYHKTLLSTKTIKQLNILKTIANNLSYEQVVLNKITTQQSKILFNNKRSYYLSVKGKKDVNSLLYSIYNINQFGSKDYRKLVLKSDDIKKISKYYNNNKQDKNVKTHLIKAYRQSKTFANYLNVYALTNNIKDLNFAYKLASSKKEIQKVDKELVPILNLKKSKDISKLAKFIKKYPKSELITKAKIKLSKLKAAKAKALRLLLQNKERNKIMSRIGQKCSTTQWDGKYNKKNIPNGKGVFHCKWYDKDSDLRHIKLEVFIDSGMFYSGKIHMRYLGYSNSSTFSSSYRLLKEISKLQDLSIRSYNNYIKLRNESIANQSNYSSPTYFQASESQKTRDLKCTVDAKKRMLNKWFSYKGKDSVSNVPESISNYKVEKKVREKWTKKGYSNVKVDCR